MEIKIRKAGISDIDLLMEWRMRTLREVFPNTPETLLEKLRRENLLYYQSALPSDRHIACFAVCGGVIIGCGGACLYREMPSPDNLSGGCAYLMNIYTVPEFRGHGAGRKIVSWLIKEAGSRGAAKIFLETSESGRPLYEKTGFADMEGYMCLKRPACD